MDRIVSAGTTLLLAALLIGYLAIGKLTVLGLDPRVMIILATVTICHGCWVIVSRISALVRQSPIREGVSQRSVILELIKLLGLLVALALGLANYLLGFQGYLEIIPGSEQMQLGPNLQLVEKGAFSRPKQYAVTVGSGAFVDRERKLRLLVSAGGRATELVLDKGKPRSHAGLRLVYQGDGYLVALAVQRGIHDYLAAPLLLRQKGGSQLYRAPLDVTEPGASGEVTIDPTTGILAAVVKRNGVTEFSGPIRLGEAMTQGDMRLQVTATSHFGRVLVQHRNYRTETLVALGICILAGLARLATRSSRSPTAPSVPGSVG